MTDTSTHADSKEARLARARRLYDENRFAECERICRDLLSQYPDEPRALSIFGYLALRGGALTTAIETFQHLCELQPDYAGHRGALASALRQAGRHQESLAAQQACVALAPDDPEAMQNLASQYAETGQLELARDTYTAVLARAPKLGQAHYGLALIKQFAAEDPQIPQMKALLDDRELDPANRTRIAFSLGKACEDLGEFNQAFAYYKLGNDLKRGQLVFDPEQERSNAQRVIRTFSDSLRERLHGAGFASALPVFIVGMPRSGSTLVEQIIDNHPEVHGAGELPNLFRVLQRGLHAQTPAGRAFPEAVAALDFATWQQLGEAYVSSVRGLDPGARRIVDKQLYNYTLVGMIHLMLPDARIIHCVRDPLDTCVSCYTQNFGSERGFSCDLSALGQTYRHYEEIMAHWRQWLTEPMLEVAYEDVVADPETQARRLIEYLGLEWSDACLTPERSKRTVITSSLGQVRAPVYSSSLGRWRRFEKHLQPLTDALAGNA